ncbi:FabD/lysophospholipase-like protein [Annulohypoxylon nitens]|nr:FabD/lysophospholipase-like protein [Annulohypoxylon nitens]
MATEDTWKRTALALEGGGTRGFASLLMLRKLMEEIRKIEESAENPLGITEIDWEPHYSSFGPVPDDIRAQNDERNLGDINSNDRRQKTLRELQTYDGKYLPCHYFDYIGGTSTGGLGALMIGRLRMSVDECIDRYPSMSKRIFQPRISLGGAWRSKYNSRGLEEEMKAIVDERLRREEGDAKFWRLESPDDLCKTALFSNIGSSDGVPYIFRSYANTGTIGANPHNPGPAHRCEIWQAGRASSAAPGYFKKMHIDGQDYYDGGIGYNDPTYELFNDIQIHARTQGADSNNTVLAILTLGTGLKTTKAKTSGAIAKFLLKEKHIRRIHRIVVLLERQVTNTYQAARLMRDRVEKEGFLYYKWDGGEFVGTLSLDSCDEEAFVSMEQNVDMYMSQSTTRQETETHVERYHSKDIGAGNGNQLVRNQPYTLPWMRGPW